MQAHRNGAGGRQQTIILGEAGAGGDGRGLVQTVTRTDECATGSQGQAGEVSDGYAFLQGQAGCARSEAEEKGVISKWGVSHASTLLAAPCAVRPPGHGSMPGCTAGTRKGAGAPVGPLEDEPGTWLLMATCSWLEFRVTRELCLWALLAFHGSEQTLS